jgi:hypothetical protein
MVQMSAILNSSRARLCSSSPLPPQAFGPSYDRALDILNLAISNGKPEAESVENGQKPKQSLVAQGLLAQEFVESVHRNSTPDLNLLFRSKANSENPLLGPAIQKFLRGQKRKSDLF